MVDFTGWPLRFLNKKIRYLGNFIHTNLSTTHYNGTNGLNNFNPTKKEKQIDLLTVEVEASALAEIHATLEKLC